MTMLLIDCGNTRLKWARCEDGRLGAGDSVALDDAAQAMQALAAALTDGDRVVLANVAGDAWASAITACVEQQTGHGPLVVRVEACAHGIGCAYSDPATLGVDRWLAMIAARELVGTAFAVVSAGTAVTFDAVAADGRHLGGLIWPGDRLMLEALAGGTGQIGLFPPAGDVPSQSALLGTSTATAVAHGSRLAVVAAVDRALAAAGEILGAPPALIVTGGDAAALAAWLASKAEVRADLVLEGLAIVGRALD